MKKVLALVLSLSMILSSMAMSFAATPASFDDVEGTDYEAAVARLQTFGIVDGMDDGLYHPEQMLTREQFATILVRALGLESAATATSGSSFADVESGRWSAGYIAVAVGRGIIKGYPDGTFKPAAEVSYAEAATMLVRALGYKDEFLSGTWPGNYLAKAAEEDITDDVTFSPNGFADRGSVAILVNNTLDANIIKQDSYGDDDNWTEMDVTLLEEYLEIVKIEDAFVKATPYVDNGIDEDQLTVQYEDEDDDTVTKTYDVDGVDTFTLLGENLDIYLNDDDEIIYTEPSDENYTVFYDVIDGGETIANDTDSNDSNDYDDGNEMTFEVKDKDYNFCDESVFYLDNEEVDFDELAAEADGNKDVFVKVVLNDKGDIALLQGFEWENPALVVTDADSESISYWVTSEDDDKVIEADDYDQIVIMDSNGNSMDMSDIQPDDVIYVDDEDLAGDDLELAGTGDDMAYVVVVRDAITGTADSYDNEGDTDDWNFEVSGEDYDVYRTATVSLDEDDSVSTFDEATSDLDDLTAAEADVTVLLDIQGDIKHIRGGIDSSSDDLYGVVIGAEQDFGDLSIRLYTSDEQKQTFDTDLDHAYGFSAADDDVEDALSADIGAVAHITEGDVVRYTVNSDGEIDEIQLIARWDKDDPTAGSYVATVNLDANKDYTVTYGTLDKDAESDSIYLNGTPNDYDGYTSVADDVVAIDYTAGIDEDDSFSADDVDTIDWETVVGESSNTANVVALVNDKNEVKFVAFVDNFDSIGDDIYVAYLLDKVKRDGDWYADLILPNGEKERYQFNDNNDEDSVTEQSVVVYNLKSNDKFEPLDDTDDWQNEAEEVTGIVTKVSGNHIYVSANNEDTYSYTLGSDVVYYQKDDVKDFNDVDEDDFVTILVNKGSVKVVKIYDADIDDIIAGSGSEADKFLDKVTRSEWDDASDYDNYKEEEKTGEYGVNFSVGDSYSSSTTITTSEAISIDIDFVNDTDDDIVFDAHDAEDNTVDISIYAPDGSKVADPVQVEDMAVFSGDTTTLTTLDEDDFADPLEEGTYKVKVTTKLDGETTSTWFTLNVTAEED